MRRCVRWIAVTGVGALVGCRANERPTVVLKTEDFIADPATMPTTLPAANPRVPGVVAAPEAAPVRRPALAGASNGLKDVIVAPGPASVSDWPPATPSEEAVLIDLKIGEINGRPIRLRDVENDSVRLAQLSREWRGELPMPRNMKPGEREDWLKLASVLYRVNLEGILRDELLAAEARAALKPEHRQGLRAFVEEVTQSKRRTLGGSTAELERYLQRNNQDQQRFGRDIEAQLLVSQQLKDAVENRVKASWRDIKRYYQRHIDRYQPPAMARFRMIAVSEANKEGISAVQAALDKGDPFAQVASLPANTYNAEGGGLFGEAEMSVTGPYEEAELFTMHELNVAARALKPGEFTRQPVTVSRRSGNEVTWLYLESLTNTKRSLSDPDIQIQIADSLTGQAVEDARDAYIRRLVRRATYNDIDTMVKRLVEVAAERYWPSGG